MPWVDGTVLKHVTECVIRTLEIDPVPAVNGVQVMPSELGATRITPACVTASVLASSDSVTLIVAP